MMYPPEANCQKNPELPELNPKHVVADTGLPQVAIGAARVDRQEHANRRGRAPADVAPRQLPRAAPVTSTANVCPVTGTGSER